MLEVQVQIPEACRTPWVSCHLQEQLPTDVAETSLEPGFNPGHQQEGGREREGESERERDGGIGV